MKSMPLSKEWWIGLAKLKSSLGGSFPFAYYVAEKYDMAHSSSGKK